MSNHKEQAEAIERERALLRAQNIDRAMDKAAQIYRSSFNHDPYAMHKAVESLPTSVLAHILQGKLDDDLCSKPLWNPVPRGVSPIRAVRANFDLAHALKEAVMEQANQIREVFQSSLKPHQDAVNGEIEAFLNNHFHKLPGIVPGKTNFHLVRALFDALYGDKGIRSFEYRRGSGATTTVMEWLKWRAPKALIIQSRHLGERQIYAPFANLRCWTHSFVGMSPDIVIVEDHSYLKKSRRSHRAFEKLVETLPFGGIWLRAYES